MTTHELLAPLRAHARKSPSERLGIDRAELLGTLVGAMRGAQSSVQRHVEEVLWALAPRLYDLWEPASALEAKPAWLAPLSTYLPRELPN